MNRCIWLVVAMLVVVPVMADAPEKEDAPRTPKEALRRVHDIIGNWRGTGTPSSGTREEKEKGFWLETINWEWQFKGKDVWLKADIAKGKYYTAFEMRYLLPRETYELKAITVDKDTHTFEGKLKDKRLTLERTDAKTRQGQRLVFSLLHANRHLYSYEVRGAQQTLFSRVYQVGVTKNGVPFANSDGRVECIVSGGLGTSAVMHKGKTYYVCCSGCRDAFNEDPEKYIREFEEAKKKKEKE